MEEIQDVAEEEVINVLKEVGIQADKEQLKALMTALKGKKLHELISAGMSKIQSVGAAGKLSERILAPAAPVEPAKETQNKGKPETKKEEKKEEEKKEDDALAAGGINIFGEEA